MTPSTAKKTPFDMIFVMYVEQNISECPPAYMEAN